MSFVLEIIYWYQRIPAIFLCCYRHIMYVSYTPVSIPNCIILKSSKLVNVSATVSFFILTKRIGWSQQSHRRWFLSIFTGHSLQAEFQFSNGLCSWGDWFESCFVGNPEDWFCLIEAQIIEALIRLCNDQNTLMQNGLHFFVPMQQNQVFSRRDKYILKDFRKAPPAKCLNAEYIHHVKNEIDKFRHLACIQKRKLKCCALWLSWRRYSSETTQIQKVTEYQYLP